MSCLVSNPMATAAGLPALLEGEIHLWRVLLDEWSAEATSLAGLLGDDEVRRAERLRSDQLRHRFVVRRALLRRVLSRYTGIAPELLKFGAGSFGKPFLASGSQRNGLEFSASHSQSTAVFAVTRARMVGVDVECGDTRPMDRSHAEIFLSERELVDWERMTLSDRSSDLLRRWTIKEACLKAVGVGLSVDPKCLEVPAACSADDKRVRLCLPEGMPLDMAIHCWEPVAGYIAALAYAGDRCQIDSISYPDETTQTAAPGTWTRR